jgi:predicted DNA-binding protein
MKSTRKKASPARKKNRASISFPPEVYSELEKLAVAKKVSLAWIVREATEKYLADQWPLLAERK